MIGPIKQKLFEYSAAWGMYQRDHARGQANDADLQKIECLWHSLIEMIDGVEASDELRDPRDIFNHLDSFNSPEKIQIVAPGLNGAGHHNDLDPCCFTIVVNKAIELPIRKDIWIVADYKQSTTTDWFPFGIRNHADIACLQTEWLSNAFPDAPWSFGCGPLIDPDEMVMPINGVLRYGTTVSGQALQLAYWLAPKEIVLCGLDFVGSEYFDRTNRNLPPHHRLWKVKIPMNRLIKWIINRGIKITSLSKTFLTLE